VGAEKCINKAASLRPSDPKAKAALHQLENAYLQYLNAGLAALEKRDYDRVGVNLGTAMMLRPHDERTAKAIQQLQIVSSSGINQGSASFPSNIKSARPEKFSGNGN
jgi:hypothetical protein